MKPERHLVFVELVDTYASVSSRWKFVGVGNVGVVSTVERSGDAQLIHAVALLIAAQDILDEDYPFIFDDALKLLTDMLADEVWDTDQRPDLVPRLNLWGADSDYTEELPF